jgi:glycerophosphoryl diester phosphodiesterase
MAARDVQQRARGEAGDFGEAIGGPPWILGHRGTPREAPENSLSGLRRALELSLDGFEYDLRACATGEAVLLHDATLDRTTNAHGALGLRTLPELASVDAGSWFGRDFEGEPLALFEEALEVIGDAARPAPLHMIELKESGLVESVAARLRELSPQPSVRLASFLREVVLEARDHDLPTMLLAEHASEVDRRFVRRERILAYGTGPRGWNNEAGTEDWPCERRAWSVDAPEDLLAA